jgi:hypothetical protein
MAMHDQEPDLNTAMGWKEKLSRRVVFGILSTLLPLGTVWSGETGTQRPYGWRWGIDPIPLRYPQPSLLGSTGYFDLPTAESL